MPEFVELRAEVARLIRASGLGIAADDTVAEGRPVPTDATDRDDELDLNPTEVDT